MTTRTVAALLCSAALFGCEGAVEPADPLRADFQASAVQERNPLLGSWALTSAAAPDEIEIPPDFSLVLTLWDDMTFSLTATNTSGNFVCTDPLTSCTVSGTYEYTATTLTLDTQEGPSPEFGPDTGLYALCGGRLIYLDYAGDEDGIRLTFVRTRRDCYVNDCA